jgi:dihydroneopterin aldolase
MLAENPAMRQTVAKSAAHTATVNVMDLILVPGLRALGVHGVLPEEKVRAQPFEVNLELSVDLSRAGQSDDLSDTVSYADVIESVERVITHERFELIERLAQRIADVCRSDARVTQVVVEVRKLRPPVPVEVGHVAVRIVR